MALTVFLDIQMPVEDGFSLLKRFDKVPFRVIFTTAYDQYAIKAIKFSALDYLLKPIDKTDLQLALNKYEQSQRISDEDSRISVFRQNILSGNLFGKLGISTLNEVIFIDLNDIMYFESDSNYTRIHTNDKNNVILSSRNIGYYDDLLKTSHFFRSHNSYIVNLKKITKYIRSKTGAIELENGATLEVSKRRKEQFMKILNKI